MALLVGAVVAALTPATYRAASGSLTFSVRPAWPGGRLVLPLGPAGEFALRTHRTPLDIAMAYELPAGLGSLGPEAVGGSLPSLQASARDAFVRYLLSRLPWLLLAGAAAGALVAGRRRRLWIGPLAGVAAAAVLTGAVVSLTFATLDRSPTVEYRGLASDVARVLPLVRALGSGDAEGGGLGRLADFVAGLEAVASQLTEEPPDLPREQVARLLLVSDVHDNVFAMRAASRLAAGAGAPVDGVLIAGDVTNLGTRAEAEWFTHGFDAAGAPVLLVGGNHENRPAMAAFARAGYDLLDADTGVVAGVTVYGGSDPLASSPVVDSDPAGLAADAERLLAGWEALPAAPQVLLVHDLAQAAGIVAATKEAGETLVVAYGNDHVAGVRREGAVTLVDAGTAGASGYEDIGAGSDADSAFQLIDFSREAVPHPLAVTTLRFARDGRTLVEYTPLL